MSASSTNQNLQGGCGKGSWPAVTLQSLAAVYDMKPVPYKGRTGTHLPPSSRLSLSDDSPCVAAGCWGAIRPTQRLLHKEAVPPPNLSVQTSVTIKNEHC